MLVTE